ncbi:hypothetical protein PIB30_011493 [Stylosanthes scabra]|uniref:Uncharacterized protein n=1 Tax=Stylosanthes scabra TaxID=79078 RepID=A0ABU6S5R9_9FABA|nr:hypothetical protein [Stylosanthes scabra]
MRRKEKSYENNTFLHHRSPIHSSPIVSIRRLLFAVHRQFTVRHPTMPLFLLCYSLNIFDETLLPDLWIELDFTADSSGQTSEDHKIEVDKRTMAFGCISRSSVQFQQPSFNKLCARTMFGKHNFLSITSNEGNEEKETINVRIDLLAAQPLPRACCSHINFNLSLRVANLEKWYNNVKSDIAILQVAVLNNGD